MPDNPHRYRYAGRVIASQWPIQELPTADAAAVPLLRITMAAGLPDADELAAWQHDFRDSSGAVTLTCTRVGDGHLMEFPGIARIHADHGGAVTVVGITDCEESVRHVLLDQAMPRLLAQHGELVLHAAIVRTLSGRTLLLLGESGRGKSTLTGAMLASGHEVLTDDGALLDLVEGTVLARRTYPSVRLLPDSLSYLFPSSEPTTLPMAHYSHKRRLTLEMDTVTGTLPVDAVIVLGEPVPSKTPSLNPISPGASCLMMLRHGFQLDLSDTANVAHLLAKAADLARQIPAYRLDYPRDFARLSEVIALLDRSFGGNADTHILNALIDHRAPVRRKRQRSPACG